MNGQSKKVGFPYKLAQYSAWPVLLTFSISLTALGFAYDHPMIAFNLSYIILAISLLLLERAMPFEPKWQQKDGQLLADIGHTLVSKGTVQAILVFGGVIGLSEIVKPAVDTQGGMWPASWIMPLQVLLGLIIAEFGLYWAHRMAHEWKPLWPYHSIHHSVTRLWVVNTGRFHFIDSLISIVLGSGLLLIAGAPLEVIQWVSAVTAFIGILTHCNVDMKFGPISYVFNTPELHRWHHSKDLKEGDKNYCENIMIWDHVFRSFYNADYRPPSDIGIKEYMPMRFREQLVLPFRWKRVQAEHNAKKL